MDNSFEKARQAYGTGAYDDATLEFLFPQLKESEDERVRKFLVKHVSEWIGCIEHDLKISSKDIESEEELAMFKASLAYLEKQKEQTENATKALAKILKDSAEGFRRILKKKGIDHEVSDKFWENTAAVYSKEEDVEFHKWMDDLMGPTPIEETYEYKKGLEAGMKQKEQKSNIEKLREISTPADENWFEVQKQWEKEDEQKPLSTEETELNSIAFLEQVGYTCIPPKKEQKPTEKQDYSGLNDLERAILRGFLAAGVENVPVTIIKETAQDCLAHIDKPAEWSEEDEEMLDAMIDIVSNSIYEPLCPREGMLAWLKSLRPSWKPSEEQMKHLERCFTHGHTIGLPNQHVLESLYNDLKKLM